MRYHEILNEMSRDEARAIWLRAGIDPNKSADLKNDHRALVRKFHPDHGGNEETMKLINAAYDVLKSSPKVSSRSGYSSRPQYQPDEEESVPQWAWAGYSSGLPPSAHIYRQDYRDVNYIKKRMWELSDHSSEEWTIEGFDGAFLRSPVTVYGSPKIFKQMAEAMIMWQTKGGNPYPCRAVLVQKRRSTEPVMYIIWADGVFYTTKPIPIEYDSFNKNPSNDSSFNRRLKALIDKLFDDGP